jgi:hypothetical protein
MNPGWRGAGPEIGGKSNRAFDAPGKGEGWNPDWSICKINGIALRAEVYLAKPPKNTPNILKACRNACF